MPEAKLKQKEFGERYCLSSNPNPRWPGKQYDGKPQNSSWLPHHNTMISKNQIYLHPSRESIFPADFAYEFLNQGFFLVVSQNWFKAGSNIVLKILMFHQFTRDAKPFSFDLV